MSINRLKKVFFEQLAADESILNFIQEYATKGMCCFFKENISHIWIDSKLSKTLGHKDLNEKEYLPYSQIFSTNAITHLKESFIVGKKYDVEVPFQLTFQTAKDGFLPLSCMAYEVDVENNTLVIVAVNNLENKSKINIGNDWLANINEVEKYNYINAIYNQNIFFFGIMDVDANKDFRYAFLNKYYEDVLGVKGQNLYGKTPTDIAPEYITVETSIFITNTFKSCYETGETKKFEAEIEILGKKRLTAVYVNPIKNGENQIIQIVACGIDITEIKESEMKLMDSNDFLVKIYEETPAMLHSIDAEGNLKFVSNQWLKEFGYTREEVIGKNTTDFLTEASRKYAVNEALPTFFRDGYGEDIRYEMLKKNGEIMHVSLYGKMLSVTFDSDTVSMAVIHDISKEVLAEKAKTKTESLLTDILNNTKIHLWAFNGNKYVYMNEAWFEYTGQDRSLPLTIERWLDVLHPDDKPTATAIWLKNKEAKTAHENYFRLKRHDGIYRSFYCYVAPVWDKDGEFAYFQGYNIDITDRLLAEEALRKSQERLELSIDGANVGLWDWNIETGSVTFNDKWYTNLGYSLAELGSITADKWVSLFHPNDLEKSNKIRIKHFNRESEYYVCEVRMKHKNGHWLWTFIRGKVFEWSSEGKPQRMLGVQIDINERKRSEVAIKQSEARLYKLTQNVPGAIYQFEMNPQGGSKFTFLSRSFKVFNNKLYIKQAADEFETGLDYLHPEDKQGFYEAMEYSRRYLTPFDEIYRLVDDEGKIEWYNAKSKPEKQEDGRVIWYGIVQNINEKIQYQKEIERLAHISENTSDLIVTTDKKGKITWANKIHNDLLGFKLEELIGKKPIEVLKSPEEEIPNILALQKALTAFKSYKGVIQVNHNLTDKPIWLSFNVNPIFDENGEFQYTIVSKRDVSDLIQKQKELQMLLDMSSDHNNRLKEYSYITSHNIRSNVASILGLIDLLVEEPNEKLYIDKLSVVAHNLDITIRNISDLLQLEKEFSYLEKSAYNISTALERILALNEKLIQAKKANIKINVLENLTINTVTAYFDSIIQNLLTNALKYGVTDNAKNIEISIVKEANDIKIVVTDKGLGIDLVRFGDKLFTLGARFHNIAKGQGLGLFMTLRQVEALGGKIAVESEENEGATFIVTLPS